MTSPGTEPGSDSTPATEAVPGPDKELPTIYDLVGGREFFVTLIDRFYDLVDGDPRIRPMYPPDLTQARINMVEFLSQYWGGPSDYSDRKGHPRLRMRHAPFSIDVAGAQAWLDHMMAALDSVEVHPEIDKAMRDYFAMGASHMVNTASDA